ncbi:hypothetical protein EMIT0158MI4_200127 [Burkholderia ambifaria]
MLRYCRTQQKKGERSVLNFYTSPLDFPSKVRPLSEANAIARWKMLPMKFAISARQTTRA